jgi:Family of unknown function (DUF6640)
MIRTAQILLTLTAIQFGIIPLFADLNPTHIFHEGWLPHARFHTAWGITVGACFAIYVLVLAWTPTEDRATRLRYASVPGCIFFGAFLIIYLLQDAFGGALADVEDAPNILGINANLFAFSIAAVVQVVATVITLRLRNT